MTAPTRVVFRVFPGGDVIALFPDQWDRERNLLGSYQHIGQHGDASPGIVEKTRPASEHEYAPLLAELVSIGYAPLILQKRLNLRRAS